IAGIYRSRPLRSMPGRDLRPTSDRLRETLFNVLTAGNPSALEGTVWVDLFAGTGAVGIEALSRGAAMVHFVESSVKAAQLIQKNLQLLGIATGFEVLKQDAIRAVGVLEKTNSDFVFFDPPYRMDEAYKQTLEALAGSSLLRQDGTVVAEHDKRFDPGEKFGRLQRSRKLEQGDSALSFYKIT
ncbi:MAG TPA: 16S rRNA (guanine(966)-N(2))-methyltransferase RsmD, partial [Terriglobales bacterium]|nr:16S rRNA (guanine(966)-N(2))-methyltransferase RsmD [Terriglobales bacterium]